MSHPFILADQNSVLYYYIYFDYEIKTIIWFRINHGFPIVLLFHSCSHQIINPSSGSLISFSVDRIRVIEIWLHWPVNRKIVARHSETFFSSVPLEPCISNYEFVLINQIDFKNVFLTPRQKVTNPSKLAIVLKLNQKSTKFLKKDLCKGLSNLFVFST